MIFTVAKFTFIFKLFAILLTKKKNKKQKNKKKVKKKVKKQKIK